jgi:hypothetical protein
MARNKTETYRVYRVSAVVSVRVSDMDKGRRSAGLWLKREL